MTFPGLDMGIFSGAVALHRVPRRRTCCAQEAIAKTEEPSVAYKYVAGLKGMAIGNDTRLRLARHRARPGSSTDSAATVNADSVAVKARNRLAMVEPAADRWPSCRLRTSSSSRAKSRPTSDSSTTARTSDNSFAIGVRQADREEPYRPYGVSDAEWEKTAHEARHDINNFALVQRASGNLAAHAGLFLPQSRR